MVEELGFWGFGGFRVVLGKWGLNGVEKGRVLGVVGKRLWWRESIIAFLERRRKRVLEEEEEDHFLSE